MCFVKIDARRQPPRIHPHQRIIVVGKMLDNTRPVPPLNKPPKPVVVQLQPVGAQQQVVPHRVTVFFRAVDRRVPDEALFFLRFDGLCHLPRGVVTCLLREHALAAGGFPVQAVVAIRRLVRGRPAASYRRWLWLPEQSSSRTSCPCSFHSKRVTPPFGSVSETTSRRALYSCAWYRSCTNGSFRCGGWRRKLRKMLEISNGISEK